MIRNEFSTFRKVEFYESRNLNSAFGRKQIVNAIVFYPLQNVQKRSAKNANDVKAFLVDNCTHFVDPK